MLVSENRPPRNLKWYHAGPLLFGDWGTSRLYVLGLAFYYTAHASVLYLAAMSLIMAAVAWAYTVVCRCFPDGGGVYSAARRLSPTLAVLGATLLLCDYIVTAALSGIEAFHYLGVGSTKVVIISVAAIAIIGVVNWLGARNAGRMALVIAVLSIALSAFIAILCLPWLGEGIKRVSLHDGGQSSPWQMWESLVRIVLALSGLEAVANMTGLMKAPVAKTAKRTIWPVLCEVVLLNLIFGIALSAMPAIRDQVVPDYVRYEQMERLAPENVPAEVKQYRDTAMKVVATETAKRQIGERTGQIFGIITGIIFGLLLLSAVNTAVMAMVSVQYSLAQDGELPRMATRLNYSGVPWIPLIIACAAPAVLLMVEADVKALGELYAIGVVGAITINLFSCAANSKLAIGKYERMGLWSLAALMAVIFLTIVVAKPNATIFAGVIVTAVLITRFLVRMRARRIAASPLPEPTIGWIAQIRDQPAVPGPGPRALFAEGNAILRGLAHHPGLREVADEHRGKTLPDDATVRSTTFTGLRLRFCAEVGSYSYRPSPGDVVTWEGESWWEPGTFASNALPTQWRVVRQAKLVVHPDNFWPSINEADCNCAGRVGFTLVVDAVTGVVVRYQPGLGCVVC